MAFTTVRYNSIQATKGRDGNEKEEGTKREPRGNREVLKVGENGVRGYIDEGGEIKVENCRRKCGENGGKMRETD